MQHESQEVFERGWYMKEMFAFLLLLFPLLAPSSAAAQVARRLL